MLHEQGRQMRYVCAGHAAPYAPSRIGDRFPDEPRLLKQGQGQSVVGRSHEHRVPGISFTRQARVADDAAVADEEDAIACLLDLAEQMARHEHARAEAGWQRTDELPEFGDTGGVRAVHRFVEDEGRRGAARRT